MSCVLFVFVLINVLLDALRFCVCFVIHCFLVSYLISFVLLCFGFDTITGSYFCFRTSSNFSLSVLSFPDAK